MSWTLFGQILILLIVSGFFIGYFIDVWKGDE
jgi:hypothetical protein